VERATEGVPRHSWSGCAHSPPTLAWPGSTLFVLSCRVCADAILFVPHPNEVQVWRFQIKLGQSVINEAKAKAIARKLKKGDKQVRNVLGQTDTARVAPADLLPLSHHDTSSRREGPGPLRNTKCARAWARGDVQCVDRTDQGVRSLRQTRRLRLFGVITTYQSSLLVSFACALVVWILP